MKTLLLAMTATLLTSGAASAQVDRKDFFCLEEATQIPFVFKTKHSIGETCAPKAEGVCMESAQCAYFTDDDKQVFAIRGKDKVAWDHATEDQKKDYVKSKDDDGRYYVDTIPTMLVCPGKLSGDGKAYTCPSPEFCKGDVLPIAPAGVDYSTSRGGAQDAIGRVGNGQPDLVHPGTGAPAAK